MLPDSTINNNLCGCSSVDQEDCSDENTDFQNCTSSQDDIENIISLNMTAEDIFNITIGHNDVALDNNLSPFLLQDREPQLDRSDDYFTFDEWFHFERE